MNGRRSSAGESVLSRLGILCAAVAALAGFAALSAQQAEPAREGLADVLSPAQAARGEALFGANCAECHTPAQPAGFAVERWVGRSLGEFHQQVSRTMPPERFGSLSAQDYLDVIAYSFRAGGVGLRGSGATAEDAAWRSLVIAGDELAAAAERPAPPDREWTAYRGDTRSQGYISADQITADNVAGLTIAWRWTGRNFGPSPEVRNITTPLMVEGRLFFTTGVRRDVVAVDAATGETLWMYRPPVDERFENAPRKGSGRGVAFWRDPAGGGRVLTITPAFRLVALDAESGLPVEGFGEGGVVDLMEGLRGAPAEGLPDIGSSSPPLVVGDVVVVGPAHLPGTVQASRSNVKGDVRGYDARSGRLLWTFRTVPDPGEPNADTWEQGSGLYTGNAGVWAPMSADEELGLVYLPVEAATNDYYGGMRPGTNLYSSSLVCLDATTGELRWHFQTTHHDIWDRDLPTAPILVDIERPGGTVKAVVQLTKQAFAFVFDRTNGAPLWPIEERPTPTSDVPGEWTYPTQPFPTHPAPFDRQGFQLDDLVDFTPAIHAQAEEVIAPFRLSELYTPFSLLDAPDGTRGTIAMPFSYGGANWEGGAVDPETGMLYVPSSTLPFVVALEPPGEGSDSGYVARLQALSVDGIPVVKPPYGRITAIDLATGEHVWMQPNGDTPAAIRDHPALAGVDIGRTGKPTRSGLLVTPTLLFAGEGWMGAPVLHALDKRTGERIAAIDLPGSQTGVPMSYVWQGKQYIVMSVSDGQEPAEIVALALP